MNSLRLSLGAVYFLDTNKAELTNRVVYYKII